MQYILFNPPLGDQYLAECCFSPCLSEYRTGILCTLQISNGQCCHFDLGSITTYLCCFSLFSASTDCGELPTPFARRRRCCWSSRSPEPTEGMLSACSWWAHTCPVPIWPAGMKAAYWKKPYTCIQMWVDPSSSQGQTFSLSSHCSHHPLASPCHAQTCARRGLSGSWLGPHGSSSSQHADPVVSPMSRPGSRWRPIRPSLSLASGPWIRSSCPTQTPSVCTKKPPHPGEGLETVLGEETGQPALVGVWSPHQPLLLSAHRAEP